MKSGKEMFNDFILALSVVFIIVLFFMAPIFTIASLNAIFNMGIQYTFVNWFSVLWLHLILTVRKSKYLDNIL